MINHQLPTVNRVREERGFGGITSRPTKQRRVRRVKTLPRKRQKREVPPGAETPELEGWKPFAWKHNALRHSFISYRVLQVQDVAKVSLEAGNSPRMVFSNYRELVRVTDAEKWFGIEPETVEAVKAAREQKAKGQKPANVLHLPKTAAA